MSGVNKVILVGYVGKDPEIRHLENGAVMAKFTLATTESYKKEGQRIEQTEWHYIVMWRQLAEIVEKYVKKGQLLYIEGKLRTRSWDDKDGNKKYTTEIVADSMTMLGKRTDDQGGNSGANNFNNTTSNVPETSPAADVNDDLPF